MLPALLLATLLAQTPPADAPAPAPPSTGGAPADDYGFVAWCRGALSGHMDLYRQTLPEMTRVREEKLAAATAGKPPGEAKRIREASAKEAAHDAELDKQQLAAGREYLQLYTRALNAAEEAGASRTRGVDITGQGYRIWAAARAGAARDRMYSYLMWELPGRCETAAKALEQNSGLLGEAFRRETPLAAPSSQEAEPTAAPPAEAPPSVDPPASPPPPSQPAPGA